MTCYREARYYFPREEKWLSKSIYSDFENVSIKESKIQDASSREEISR